MTAEMLNRFITVPTTDPDDARRRRLLNILLFGIAIFSVITFVAVIIADQFNALSPSIRFITYISPIAVFFGAVIFNIINRSSRIPGWLTSALFLIFFTLLLAFIDTPNELANGRSLFVFTIPVIMSCLLVNPRSGFIFALLASIEITILALIAKQVPNTFAVIGFFLVALVSWLSSRSLENALHDLRAINSDLDKIVTERTRALAESLTRERIDAGRNQAILNSIADGVVVFSSDNIAMLVNPALSQLTETPMNDLAEIGLSNFVQTRQLSPASQKIIKGLIEHPEEIEEGVRVEWGKKTLSVSIARVQDTFTNENIGTVAVFRDVTREAELEKMKTTFVGIVSHELRTPLNAIMGYAEMLKESIYGPINEKQSSVTERIMVNTQRLLGMVGDLLDEAQMKAGKLSIRKQTFKTSSLLENMHNTMDKVAFDKGLYLTDESDPNMPETITGDPQRLGQILVNLVNNSVKFTEKGYVHVRILRSDENHWRFEITDTGAGIPEEEIPFIFETFRQVESSTTRQHGGFGLGLAIVKQLVELMKGQITVKTGLNKGSTFTVTLPL